KNYAEIVPARISLIAETTRAIGTVKNWNQASFPLHHRKEGNIPRRKTFWPNRSIFSPSIGVPAQASAASTVFFKHGGRHWIRKSPDHLNWAFLLKLDKRCWSKEGERCSSSVQLLTAPGKDQNRVTAI